MYGSYSSAVGCGDCPDVRLSRFCGDDERTETCVEAAPQDTGQRVQQEERRDSEREKVRRTNAFASCLFTLSELRD
jgi:hypothetical protein